MSLDHELGQLIAELSQKALTELQRDLETAIRREQAQERQASRSAWRRWVQDSSLGWQHRWTKDESARWSPGDIQHKGVWSGQPTHLLASEVARLGDIWNVDAEPVSVPDIPADPLPDITLEELQEALKRYSHSTASTYDGLHPLHIALLSRDQQQVFLEFLHC